MALKALMLRKKIDDKKALLEELRAKLTEFQEREAELEKSIEEASTDEEKKVVEEEIEKFEAEKAENEKEVKDLETEVSELEGELKETEERQKSAVVEKRGEEKKMVIGEAKRTARTKFYGMSHEERTAFFEKEEVKAFIDQVRTAGQSKRNVTGTELLIPEVVLELVHADIEEYSKLYKHVNAKPVKGKARQNIMGDTPEGIWTEMVGKINELELSFTDVEVDGYKVAGYVPVPNSILEDSDIALGSEIIMALGKSLGLALDKAILYGKKASKMPTGIITAIDTKAEIKTKNIVSIAAAKTDLALFKAIVEATTALKHGEGNKFWAMNSTTHTKLLAASIGANSGAAIVAGMQNTMPVIGGEIVELEFIPDDVMIGGFGARYLLAERAGTTVASSSEYQFLDDNTVYKATARYDGKPVFEDAFMAIGINGATPAATDVTFAEDKANKAPATDPEATA